MDKIYYICKYSPLELIKGFDIDIEKPDMEVINFECADSCSHPNLCGFGKAILENIIKQNIKNIILVDCCDVCRRLYDILSVSDKMDFVFLFNLPHKNDKDSLNILKEELIRLKKSIELHFHKKFDTQKAIKYLQEQTKENTKIFEPHIEINGAHCEETLLKIAKELSAFPIIDKTCNGSRILAPFKTQEDNFLEAYSYSLLNQQNSCVRMLFDNKQINENTKGLICHTIKFCDYWGFHFKDINASLKIPILKLETDYSSQSQGQLSTRLSAFFEILNKKTKETKAISQDIFYVIGIDSGSTSTKGVILNNRKEIISSAIIPTGTNAKSSAENVLNLILEKANLTESDIKNIVTTGYGRDTLNIKSNSITEITCHAKGANYLFPKAKTVIDIGGQDLKIICINENGDVENFVMNDKCAAGTGRFLEMMSKILELNLDEMSEKGLNGKNNVEISSMCSVFAESEVVSLIANNTPIEDIINGLNNAVALKLLSLINRTNAKPSFIMTGGVSKNKGIVNTLSKKLNNEIFVSEKSQLCGAIGAAIFAL